MSRLSERVIFNGKVLQDMVPGAHLVDILVGQISTDHKVQEHADGPGSIFVRKRDSTRPIRLRVELPMDKGECMINYNLLRAWAESENPQPLLLPNAQRGYINCVLSSMSEINVWNWYEPIELDFIAYDPYFYGVERVATANTAFVVYGDISTWYRIEATLQAAVTSPVWLIDEVTTVGLVGSIGVGKLVIDAGRGLVTLGDNSINAKLSLATRFKRLSPGKHIIASTVTSKVYWREGYR